MDRALVVGALFGFAVAATALFCMSCGTAMTNGKIGFDLSRSQQLELKNSRLACKKRGGEFYMQIDNRKSPPTYTTFCEEQK